MNPKALLIVALYLALSASMHAFGAAQLTDFCLSALGSTRGGPFERSDHAIAEAAVAAVKDLGDYRNTTLTAGEQKNALRFLANLLKNENYKETRTDKGEDELSRAANKDQVVLAVRRAIDDGTIDQLQFVVFVRRLSENSVYHDEHPGYWLGLQAVHDAIENIDPRRTITDHVHRRLTETEPPRTLTLRDDPPNDPPPSDEETNSGGGFASGLTLFLQFFGQQ